MTWLDAAGGALVEILLVKIFYWPGWLVLRGLTIGHYPPQEAAAEAEHNKEFVAFIGLLAFLVPGIAFLVA